MAPITSLEPASLQLDLPIEQIDDFCQRHHVIELSMFGSVLRPDFAPDSDVDVIVTFDATAKPSLLTMSRMTHELEAILGRPVDLLSRRGVEQMRNPHRRSEILRTSRVIYAR